LSITHTKDPAVAVDPVAPAAVATPEQFRMRGVGRHALVYGLGSMLGKAVAFIMLPIYTRFLAPADYGVLALIEMTLDVISIVAGAQLALGVFRFYHKAETEKERNSVVSTAFLLLAGTYAAVGTAALLAAPFLSQLVFGSAEHTVLFRIAAVSLVTQALPIVPFAFARVQDLSLFIVRLGVMKLLLAVAFNVLFLVQFRMGVAGILWSSVISNLAVGGWVTVWAIRRVGLHWSPSVTRDLVRYGAPMIATQFATFIATFGDRYFLQAHSDTTAVGLYNLAYQFGFLLAILGFAPFEQVWGPKRFAIARRPDRDDVLSRGFVYLNIWLIGLAVVMGLFVGDVLRILTTPAFHSAAAIVPVILLAYIFQSWASIQDVGVLVRERTEFITLANWLAAGVALVGYYFLVPRYLGWGAAVATVLSFFVRWAVTYGFSQMLWPVKYHWAPVIKLMLLGGVTVAAVQVLPQLPLVASLLLRSAFASAFMIACWKSAILTSEERSAVCATAVELTQRSAAYLRIRVTAA
jgi:O-antigen/teichoic acid export membrane protein